MAADQLAGTAPGAGPPCPLCASTDASTYHADRQRSYMSCPICGLVFVPSGFHLSPEHERARYDQHRNDPADPGYREFLSRLAHPLTARVPPPAEGLDFGCGPGPALPAMLEEQGYDVELFDPYYANEPSRLEGSYDFITCSEVLEHLANPWQTLIQLRTMLRPGGWLGIMTKLVLSPERFAGWHYIRDPTHICFFSRETFVWLADALELHLEFVDSDVILLQRGLWTR